MKRQVHNIIIHIVLGMLVFCCRFLVRDWTLMSNSTSYQTQNQTEDQNHAESNLQFLMKLNCEGLRGYYRARARARARIGDRARG